MADVLPDKANCSLKMRPARVTNGNVIGLERKLFTIWFERGGGRRRICKLMSLAQSKSGHSV